MRLLNLLSMIVFSVVLLFSTTCFAQNSPKGEQLTENEKKLVRVFGKSILVKLSKIGSNADKFIYADRLIKVAKKKIKVQKYRDARYFLRRTYEEFPSPVVRYYQAIATCGSTRYFLCRSYYKQFIKESLKWNLTTIKKEFIEDAKDSINLIQKTKLVTLLLKINIKGAKVAVGEDILGYSPLAKVYIPAHCTLTISKKGYVKKELLINSFGGKIIKKSVELISPEEKIRRNKIFQLEKEKKKRIARLLKLEKINNYKKNIKRKRFYHKVGKGLLISGGTALFASVSSYIFSFINKKKIENAHVGDEWSKYKSDYDFYNRALTISSYSAVIGSIIAVSGGILCYMGHKKIAQKPEQDNKPIDKFIKSFSIVPVASSKNFGLIFNFRF